jgi:hypothetical protein
MRRVVIHRWRAVAAMGVVGLVVALAPVGLGGIAQAASSFSTTVVNQGNGNCADVPNGASTSALALIQWSCNSGSNQSFAFTAVSGSSNTYSIATVTSGSCIDIFGASSADNAAVIQYACHSGTNQQFRLQPVSVSGATNTFNLVSVASGKCVAPGGDASASNTELVQLSCSSATSRVWRLPNFNGGGSPPATQPPTTDSWNPPAKYLSPLAANWKHQEDTYANLYGFKNYLWDQVIAAKGSINYCVRWESTATVSAALRDQVESSLARQFQKWVDQLQENGHGWMGFPYTTVPVKVVGWAVRDRNQLQWTDDSRDIYVNNIREGAPQCSEPCGRFFHQDGDYSGCPGGTSHHYDMSLWLTSGFGGGAGGDWGQRISSEYYVQLLGADNIHILLHEMGHSWGLNDFYDYDPLPSEGFVMKAGSATLITEFDKWMLRDFWRHLKNRYGL